MFKMSKSSIYIKKYIKDHIQNNDMSKIEEIIFILK